MMPVDIPAQWRKAQLLACVVNHAVVITLLLEDQASSVINCFEIGELIGRAMAWRQLPLSYMVKLSLIKLSC